MTKANEQVSIAVFILVLVLGIPLLFSLDDGPRTVHQTETVSVSEPISVNQALGQEDKAEEVKPREVSIYAQADLLLIVILFVVLLISTAISRRSAPEPEYVPRRYRQRHNGQTR